MLSPEQVSAGTLADAKGPLLVLPRTKYERISLVVLEGEGFRAICLSEPGFPSFECAGNTHWAGMFVHDIRFEVDQESAFEANYNGILGSLVRSGTSLRISASPSGHSFGRLIHYDIETGLPPCGEGQAVGFGRWQIVAGEGVAKQILHTVEVAVPKSV